MSENPTSVSPRRVPLGLYPTPLQELPYFSTLFGGGRHLFMKREDLVGVGLGGNKIRRLEYYLGEALTQGCDCVVIAGGSKSNQTIAAAACAAKAGLPAYLVVPASTGTVTRGLADLLQAGVYYTDDGNTTTLNRGLKAVCKMLQNQGKRPYIIRPGAALPLGILGYVDAMRLMAAKEGIFLDPLFTGKAFAGLFAMAQDGCFPAGANIVFIHTGGAVTLFNSLH